MITLDTVIQQLHIWDGQILLFIQEYLRMEALNPIVIAITNLGNTGIVWIVLSIVLLFPKKTRRAGLLSLLALLGSLCVTNFLLKNYVARVRPYEVVAGLQCLHWFWLLQFRCPDSMWACIIRAMSLWAW